MSFEVELTNEIYETIFEKDILNFEEVIEVIKKDNKKYHKYLEITSDDLKEINWYYKMYKRRFKIDELTKNNRINFNAELYKENSFCYYLLGEYLRDVENLLKRKKMLVALLCIKEKINR